MKWAIIYYAIFSFPNGDFQEHITWNLAFQDYEHCKMFYNKNKSNIISGLESHLEQAYPDQTRVIEFGCAHAVADFSVEPESRKAKVSKRMPLQIGKSL